MSVYPFCFSLGITRIVLRRLEDRGGLHGDSKRILAGFLVRAGRALFRGGDEGFGRECFREARRIHPGAGFEEAYGSAMQWTCKLAGADRVRILAFGRHPNRYG